MKRIWPAAAFAICQRHGWEDWLEPAFQREIIFRMKTRAQAHDRAFGHGAAGFGQLVPKWYDV